MGRTQTCSPSYLPRGPLPWHSCGPSPGSQKQFILKATGRLVGYCGRRVRRPRPEVCVLLTVDRHPHQHHHSGRGSRSQCRCSVKVILSALWRLPPLIIISWEVNSLCCRVVPLARPRQSSRTALGIQGPACLALARPLPLPPRPPSNLTLQLFQSTSSSLNTPCPPPPLQLCQHHVFCMTSSSPRRWRDPAPRKGGDGSVDYLKLVAHSSLKLPCEFPMGSICPKSKTHPSSQPL